MHKSGFSLVLVLLLAGCSSSPAPDAHPADEHSNPDGTTTSAQQIPMLAIALEDNRFSPAQADVSVQNGAHFTNEGGSPHTVTIFDASGNQVLDAHLRPGEAHHFSPPGPGTYHVTCRFHAAMTADLRAIEA